MPIETFRKTIKILTKKLRVVRNSFIALSEDANLQKSNFKTFLFENQHLRVVQTQAILFLNVGKRPIRHRTTLNLNDFNRLSRFRNSSFNFRIVVERIRLFPTLVSKINWLGSKLPLNFDGNLLIGRLRKPFQTKVPVILYTPENIMLIFDEQKISYLQF